MESQVAPIGKVFVKSVFSSVRGFCGVDSVFLLEIEGLLRGEVEWLLCSGITVLQS